MHFLLYCITEQTSREKKGCDVMQAIYLRKREFNATMDELSKEIYLHEERFQEYLLISLMKEHNISYAAALHLKKEDLNFEKNELMVQIYVKAFSSYVITTYLPLSSHLVHLFKQYISLYHPNLLFNKVRKLDKIVHHSQQEFSFEKAKSNVFLIC